MKEKLKKRKVISRSENVKFNWSVKSNVFLLYIINILSVIFLFKIFFDYFIVKNFFKLQILSSFSKVF